MTSTKDNKTTSWPWGPQTITALNIDFGGYKNFEHMNFKWTTMDIASAAPDSKNFTLLSGIYYDFSNPTDFPLYDCAVNNYFCSGTIEHMPYDVVEFIFKEMFRTLKPNGMLRVVVPDFDIALKTYFETGKIPDHFPAGGDKNHPITRLFAFAYTPDIFVDQSLRMKVQSISASDEELEYLKPSGNFILKNADTLKFVKSGHKTVWNFDLMKFYLEKQNFVNIEKMLYNSCSSAFNGKDSDRFRDFGLFVEAEKPE